MLGMSTKRVLMCQPTYFEVSYSINAWMDTNNPVNKDLARRQWQRLFDTYKELSFDIQTIDPVDGLPDMVFTTDNGLVLGNKVVLGKFLYAERQHETDWFKKWFEAGGFQTYLPSTVFEGGDVRVLNGKIFIGYGFRTARQSHAEIAQHLDREVVSLRLVDKRFYHMDTAICTLNDQTAMYYPGAFDKPSQQLIKQHIPNLIEASEDNALTFGLNAVSDGQNVVMSQQATGLMAQIKDAGFNPIGVDISEFQKSGGGVNCLTLELRG